MSKTGRTRSEELRIALESADRSAVGRAYPPELRRAVVEHVADRRADGVGISEIAADLGLPVLTVTRWSKRESTTLFRPVSVVEARIEGRTTIVVHGPRGLRVEGLDPEGVAELIRRLA